MFDETLMEQVLAAPIIASGLFPRIAWANGGKTVPERPYLALELVPVDVVDDTTSGANPRWVGFLQGSIVMAQGGFETSGKALRKQLGDLFTKGQRLTLGATGYKIVVQRHPKTIQGYPAGGDYRLPLQIFLRTEG